MLALFLAAVKTSHRMGHEGFYNFVLVAMGNVLSTILMYALQAVWLCQRLIDRDYRQNHGSRLTPILDSKSISKPVDIVSSDLILQGTGSHKMKPTKSKTNKLETTRFHMESSKSHKFKFKKQYHRSQTNPLERRLNSSHPYFETSDSLSTTVKYVNGLDQNNGIRRAFSDINISSSCSEFYKLFDNNQNYLSNENIHRTTVSVTDQDFLRWIFTKGYVT